MSYRPRVLFVCEHDSGASRICAAYLEHLAGDRYESLAAALEPAEGLRPEAATALSEDGLTVTNGPGRRMTSDLADIVDRATDRDVETRVYQDPFGPGRYRWWRPYWRYRGPFGWRRWDPWFGDPFWANDIDVRTIQRFEASAEIVMFRGNRADDKSFAAREVLENLGPTIELPRER